MNKLWEENKKKKPMLFRKSVVKSFLCVFIMILFLLSSFSTIAYASNNNDVIIYNNEPDLQTSSDAKNNDQDTNIVDKSVDTDDDDSYKATFLSRSSSVLKDKTKDSKNIFKNSRFSLRDSFRNMIYNMLKKLFDWFPRLYNIAFMVRLLERFNDSEDNSSEDVDTTPPSRVSGLDITNLGSGKLLVSWDPAEDDTGVEKYNVYQEDNLAASVVTTSYMVSGLDEEQAYSYSVSAVDSSGNEGDQSDTGEATPSSDGSEEPSNMLPETGHISIISEGEMMLDTSLNINNEFLVTLQGNLFMDTNMESLDIWWNLSSGYFEINAATYGSGENQHFRFEDFLIRIEELNVDNPGVLSLSIGVLGIDAAGNIVISQQGDEGSLSVAGMLTFIDVEVSATDFMTNDFTFSGSVEVSVAFTGDVCLSWNESGISVPGDDTQLGAGVYFSVEDLFFESNSIKRVTADQLTIGAGGYLFVGDTVEAEFAGGLYIQNLFVRDFRSFSIHALSLESLSLSGMGFVTVTNTSVIIEASMGASLSGLSLVSDGLQATIGSVSMSGAAEIVISGNEVYLNAGLGLSISSLDVIYQKRINYKQETIFTAYIGSILLSGEASIHTDIAFSSFHVTAVGGGSIEDIIVNSPPSMFIDIASVSAGANLALSMDQGIEIYADFSVHILGLYADLNLNTGSLSGNILAEIGGLHASGGVSMHMASNFAILDLGFSADATIIDLSLDADLKKPTNIRADVDIGFIAFGGSGYANLVGGMQIGFTGSLSVDDLVINQLSTPSLSESISGRLSSIDLFASSATVDMNSGEISISGVGFSLNNLNAAFGSATITCNHLSLVGGPATIILGDGLNINGNIDSVVVDGFSIQGLDMGTFTVNSLNVDVLVRVVDFFVDENGFCINANGQVKISNIDVSTSTMNIKVDSINIPSSYSDNVVFPGTTVSISKDGQKIIFSSGDLSVSAEGISLQNSNGQDIADISSISFVFSGSISITPGNPLGIGISGSADIFFSATISGFVLSDISLEGDGELWIYDLSSLLAGDLSNIHIAGDVNSFTEFSINVNNNIVSAEFETGQVEVILDLSNLNFDNLPSSLYQGSVYAYLKGTDILTLSGLEYIIGISKLSLGDIDITVEWDITETGVGSLFVNGYASASFSLSASNLDIDIEQFSGIIDIGWDINQDFDGGISLDADASFNKIKVNRNNFNLEISGNVQGDGYLAWDFNPDDGISLSADRPNWNNDFYIRFSWFNGQWIKVWPLFNDFTGPFAYFEWYPPIPQVGEIVTFDASESLGNNLEYNWDFDDDDDDDSSPQPSTQSSSSEWYDSPIIEHVFESGGTYLVTLTVREKDSGETDSISMYVDLDNQLPVASFTMTPDPIQNHVCVGEIIKFDASCSYDPDGEIVNYKWDFNNDGTFDVTVSDKTIVYHSYSNDKDYTAKLVVADDRGGSDSVTKDFTIWDQDPANTPPEVYLYGKEFVPPEFFNYNWFGPTSANGAISHGGKTGYKYDFQAYEPPIGPSGGDTHDMDGYIREYKWDWKTSSGNVDSTGWVSINEGENIPDLSDIIWNQAGNYYVKLSVKDDEQVVSFATINLNIELVDTFSLTNPMVTPMQVEDPDQQVTLTFSVVYTDPEGNMPTGSKLLIDNGETMFSPVSANDGAPITEGRTYYQYVSSNAISDGVHSFYFEFTNAVDGTKTSEVINGPAIGMQYPIANAYVPLTGLTEENIIFSAEGSSDPDGNDEELQYRWDFDNDGNWDTNWMNYGGEIAYQYSDPGQYQVVLMVKDTDGLTDVDDAHSITIELGGPTVEVATLSASNVDDNSAKLHGLIKEDAGTQCTAWFLYRQKNSGSDWIVAEVSGTYTTNDEFSVVVTGLQTQVVYEFKACVENTAEKTGEGLIRTFYTDIDAEEFIVDAGGPYYGDVDETITLTANVISGGTEPFLYEWDCDDNGIYEKSGKSVTYVWAIAGTFSVDLRVTDDMGLREFDSATVVINDGGSPPEDELEADFTYSPADPLVNAIVHFYDQSTSTLEIEYWEWDFADGSYPVTQQQEPTHQYTSGGFYDVKLKIKDVEDNWDEVTKTVEINGPPVFVGDGITGPTSAQSGESCTFTANANDPNGDILEYKWQWTTETGTGFMTNMWSSSNTLTFSWDPYNPPEDFWIQVKVREQDFNDHTMGWSSRHWITIN